jgi:hypothetical protein
MDKFIGIEMSSDKFYRIQWMIDFRNCFSNVVCPLQFAVKQDTQHIDGLFEVILVMPRLMVTCLVSFYRVGKGQFCQFHYKARISEPLC